MNLIVRARGLSKDYPQGQEVFHALKEVDLDVRPGEFVAILGPSGSGKSTLLNLLGLLDDPTRGDLRLFGLEPKGLSEQARGSLRCRKVGFLFQFDSLLPEFTVLENVLLPVRIAGSNGAGPKPDFAETVSLARRLLEDRGLLRLAGRFPQELSGGEKQRAALARALVNRPELILADEPTGNLDRQSAELVFSDLRKLAEGSEVAVVLVTHNEDIARFATRTLHLVDGKIHERTPPETRAGRRTPHEPRKP